MNTLRYFDFGQSRHLLLLIARIALAVLFIIFGYPKLIGFSGTVQYMTSLGAPMPMLAAIIAVADPIKETTFSAIQALHDQGLSGPAVLFARNALCALVKADGQFVNTSELVKLIGGPFFEQQGLLKNALYTLDKKLTRAGLIMTQRGSNYRIR